MVSNEEQIRILTRRVNEADEDRQLLRSRLQQLELLVQRLTDQGDLSTGPRSFKEVLSGGNQTVPPPHDVIKDNSMESNDNLENSGNMTGYHPQEGINLNGENNFTCLPLQNGTVSTTTSIESLDQNQSTKSSFQDSIVKKLGRLEKGYAELLEKMISKSTEVRGEAIQSNLSCDSFNFDESDCAADQRWYEREDYSISRNNTDEINALWHQSLNDNVNDKVLSNGKMEWLIRKKDPHCTSMLYHSGVFYTSQSGYRLQLNARMERLHGDAYFRVRVMKGLFDSNLTWPLAGRMRIVISQKTTKSDGCTSYEFPNGESGWGTELVRPKRKREDVFSDWFGPFGVSQYMDARKFILECTFIPEKT